MANIIKETVRGIDVVSIEDELLKNREIFLTEEVNAQTSNELIKELMYLEMEDDEAEITLYINSPGGDVTSGLAVYDYLTMMKAPIRTVSIGLAASMGAILFLAGDKRQMLPHTQVMIHDPSYGSGNMSGKKPHEIQHALDKLNETKDKIVKIIVEKTGRTLDEVNEVMTDDTFYNAEEAVDFGLATEIIDSTAYRKGGTRS